MKKRNDIMFKINNFNNIEFLLLSLLFKSDLECFEISDIINEYSKEQIKVKDGILFTTLYYFENSCLISSYEKNDYLYYHIEEAGKIRLEMLKREYTHFLSGIQQTLDHIQKKGE